MFQASHHAVGSGDVGSLKSMHAGGGIKRAQPRVFAKAFGDAPPARVARQVHHRRKRPVNAHRRRLAGGNGLRPLEQFRLPRARLRQRNREGGAETVNRVVSENQRDAEPALFDGDVLQSVSLRRCFDQFAAAEKRTGGTAAKPVGEIRRGIGVAVQLLELPDFFRQRHPLEQIGDALWDRLRRIFVNVFFPVLVQVNPAVMINGRLRRRNGQGKEQAAGKKSVFHGGAICLRREGNSN